MPFDRGSWPFTGREGELKTVAAYLDDMAVNAVLLQGENGVGKSRLAEECLRLAGQRGYRVMRASRNAPAPWLPAAVTYHDPVTTFHAATRALGEPETGRPAGRAPARRTMLLVDNVHLLDNPSAVLLGHLLRVGAIFLLATVQDDAPPSDAVEALDRSESTRRINVPPFSHGQVREVLLRSLGHPMEHGALNALVTLSRGNALFLYELVNGAVDDGTLELGDGVWRLKDRPAGTGELWAIICHRLRGLSEPRQAILELVALCEPLPLSALYAEGPPDDKHLVDETGSGTHSDASCADAAILSDVEWLEKRGLIQLDGAGRRTYCTLGHPLYGEAIRRGIAPRRRREIYAAQVEALRRHGVRRREDALRLASWQLAAELPIDEGLLSSAAALAREVQDHRTVLELLSKLPPASESFEVWLMRGEAHHHAGDWHLAERSLVRAQDAAPGESALLIATMGRTQNLFWGLGDTARTLEVNATADAGLGESGRLAVRINDAAFRVYCGNIRTALTILEEADKVPIAAIRMWGQLQRSLALSYLGQTAQAVELSKRVHDEIMVTERNQRFIPFSPGRGAALYQLVALTEAGKLDEARSIGEDAFARAVGSQAVDAQAWIAGHLGRCELMAGRLDQARDWYAESISLARSYAYSRPLPFSWAGLAAVHAQCGATHEAQKALDVARETPSDRHQAANLTVDLATAWVEAVRGSAARAHALLATAARRARAAGMLAYESWLLGDMARLGGAAIAHDRLSELAEASDSALARARAACARAFITRDAAELRAAADLSLEAGAELQAAETAYAASQACEQEGDSRGAAAAAVLTERALSRCGRARTPMLRPGGRAPRLTPREAQIARLAADGSTSKEIAEQLVLSVRTVDNHLQRVYTKLGIGSRTQLTAALSGHTVK